MTSRRSAVDTSSASTDQATAAMPTEPSPAVLPEWMVQAGEQGIKPEQALAFIGLGLMRKLATDNQELPWIWNEEKGAAQTDLAALRQRLELISLALQTGAPLSTAEVSQLLGVRPGSAVIERGSLLAKRISRNVWKLSRAAETSERVSSGFQDGFRRRL